MPIDPAQYLREAYERNNEHVRGIIDSASEGQSSCSGDEHEGETEGRAEEVARETNSDYNNENSEEKDASGYNSYNNDGLNFQKHVFSDDTKFNVESFINNLKLTKRCQNEFIRLYNISASNDNVLTFASPTDLLKRADEFKLQILEFKNTLIGPDADSLLFGDFDLAVETLAARLKSRNSRSLDGFERISGISSYSTVSRTERVGVEKQEEEASKTGLRRIRFLRK